MRLRFVFAFLLAATTAWGRVPVVLISIDGLRPDSVTKELTPTLAEFAKNGASGRLRPVFPTLTFPNHYSIVTGLYPTQHGIVGNEMRDPAIAEDFRISKGETVRDPRWWVGEPLWVTAQKQKLRAFTMFWPGSDVEILGVRPERWKAFDASFTGDERVKTALEWFDLPMEERPDFMTLYFEHVDVAEHQNGLDSPPQRDALAKVDGWIREFLEGIEARKLRKNVHVVIVSDHGMAQIDASRFVDLETLLKGLEVDVVSKGAVAALWPKPGFEKATLERLRKASRWMKVYTPSEIPKRYHFSGSSRVPPIFCVGEEGAYISRSRPSPEQKAHYATHGYDNELKSMEAFFAAEGPRVKVGARLQGPVESLHVYALLAKLLEIDPASRTASVKPFAKLLR